MHRSLAYGLALSAQIHAWIAFARGRERARQRELGFSRSVFLPGDLNSALTNGCLGNCRMLRRL